MKISLNWLNDFIDINKKPAEVAELLTSVGLEVEAFESSSSLNQTYENVVVGHVIEVLPHPNADKLQCTKVDIGEEIPLAIVCGAPNVAVGQKVPVACVGANLVLSDGSQLKIKKGKIRGEVSQGMICAEDELGLSTNHEGIMVLHPDLNAGTPFIKTLKDDSDTVFEIGLTPNRIDAACHKGVAQDLSAVLNVPLKMSQIPSIPISQKGEITLKVEDTNLCPRYAYLIIRNVQVAASPEWLQKRLKTIGLQPINNVVDITNYVMHALGQPLHAFDLEHVKDGLIIRKAREDESLELLDGQNINLQSEELVICNQKNPLALAGVMGGKHSGISIETKDLLLESAYFNPKTVRQSAKKHTLNTDSSYRFERGADPNGVVRALELAAHLIANEAGGEVNPTIADFYPEKILPTVVLFSTQKFKQIAGYTPTEVEMTSVLESLNIKILKKEDQNWTLEIPTNKPDVQRKIDVVEELIRILGFDKVPLSKNLHSSLPTNKSGVKEQLIRKIQAVLSQNGFFELKTNPFSSQLDEFQVQVANPLSAELGGLRTSHLASGLYVLRHNINRQQKNLKFFEFGKQYQLDNDNNYVETAQLTLWLSGLNRPKTWRHSEEEMDFYHVKTAVEQIFSASISSKLITKPVENHAVYDFGLTYYHKKKVLAVIGKIKDSILEADEVEQAVFGAEINFDLLHQLRLGHKIQFENIGKFPRISRDLSFVVSQDIPYSQIEEQVKQLNIHLLQAIECFDLYKGEHIDKGSISYALRFIFESKEKTLKDQQIESYMSQIIESLEDISCKIRK